MLVKLLPLVVSLAILMFIGIVGNSIVIQVYGQRQEKSQTSHFLQSLAACNLIGCLLHMPYVIIYCVLWYSFPHHILCRAFEWLHHAQVIAVSFILLSMTLDRLLRSLRKKKMHILQNRKTDVYMVHDRWRHLGLPYHTNLRGPSCGHAHTGSRGDALWNTAILREHESGDHLSDGIGDVLFALLSIQHRLLCSDHKIYADPAKNSSDAEV